MIVELISVGTELSLAMEQYRQYQRAVFIGNVCKAGAERFLLPERR